MRTRRLVVWLTALAIVAVLPARALACAECFTSKATVLPLYIGTAILLSVLPLALIGAILLWLRHRLRAAEPEEPVVPSRSVASLERSPLRH